MPTRSPWRCTSEGGPAARRTGWARAGLLLLAWLAWLALLALRPALAQVPGTPPVALPGSAAPVVLLTLRDAIGPASADYVLRGLQRAQQQGAPLVVLELDTPGGLDGAMRQIVQALLASPVPVATYVSPRGARAASAGTYMLYASHIAAMAPATALGAATPVAMGMPGRPGPSDAPRTPRGPAEPGSAEPGDGGREMGRRGDSGDTMTAKQVNDAAAFIRGLALQHGRNAEWAERAVRESVSLTAEEALRERVIDVVASDVNDLLAQIDGRTVRTATGELRLSTQGLTLQAQPPDWRHRLLSVIANPSLAFILLMVGVYGLMFEFSSPGFGIPGTVGAIALLLALFALQLLPVNYAALALILLGFALLAAELVVPAFGVLGVGGIVAFLAGGLLLFDREVPGMDVPLPLLLGMSLAVAAAVVLGGGLALRTRRVPRVSGRAHMLGAIGRVLQVQGDEAWAEVHGERWRVDAGQDTRSLVPGQHVRVTGQTGLLLQVQPDPLADTDTTPRSPTGPTH
jgi:membrane-bound serine protease (ClpP class)